MHVLWDRGPRILGWVGVGGWETSLRGRQQRLLGGKLHKVRLYRMRNLGRPWCRENHKQTCESKSRYFSFQIINLVLFLVPSIL